MKRALFATAALSAILSSTAAMAATEIQWWHAFTGRLGELLEAHARDFNASQNEFRVVPTLRGNYSETLNAAIAAFRAGQQPHIVQVFEVGTATMMAATGAIKPVHELMAEAGKPFDTAKFLPAVTSYFATAEGNLLSFPYNSSTQVLYVNEDALKAANIAPDVSLKTWEEVSAVLDQLKAAGHACPFTTTWQSWVHLESFSARHDQPFATRENGFGGFDAELSFNGPVQVKHIETLQGWARDGKFIYAGRRSEAGARFRSGECALMTESSAGYASVKAEAKFPFQIRQLPYWGEVASAPRNTIIGGASLWVMAGHTPEQYRGVAAFFDYLSSPEVQAKWHQDTGYLPITQAAWDITKASGFYEANPGTEIPVLQMTATAPTPNSRGLRLGSFDQIRTMIDEELEAVWTGSRTPQAALDNAVTRGNEVLRRFERTARTN